MLRDPMVADSDTVRERRRETAPVLRRIRDLELRGFVSLIPAENARMRRRLNLRLLIWSLAVVAKSGQGRPSTSFTCSSSTATHAGFSNTPGPPSRRTSLSIAMPSI